MGKVYAVTSGKGGVGKSTVSVGLSLAFCKLGKKVLLVDMDEGLRCLDLMLGVDEKTVFDLSDIFIGKCIEDAVYPVEKIDGLHLIPAPSKIGLINAFSLSKFAVDAEKLYDIVIFDFPAGIDFSLYTALPDSTLFLTVAVPDNVSVRDSAIVSNKLNEISRHSKLIINSFSYKISKKRIFKNIDDIIDSSCLQLIGIVPESEELKRLSVLHTIKKSSKAMSAFLRIAQRLNGEHILLPKPKKI